VSPIRLFCGYDGREAVGFHVFVASVLEYVSKPVAIHALDSKGLPQGSNAFTFSRFLVPWLCGFEGHAIFLDGSDMLMRADIAELDALFDPRFAVQVVQHPNYRTRHPIKYMGTSMQCPNMSYPRKNWASVMLMNCGHEAWAGMSPDVLERCAGVPLLQLEGVGLGGHIGALPNEWNRLVDEGQPVDGAKVLHFTAGIPAFPRYASTPGAELWLATRDQMLEAA
jgi:hypothetical protein